MKTVGVWRHGWQGINADQHQAYVSCEPAGGEWSNTPMALTVPDGWEIAPTKHGTLELWNDNGKHVALLTLALHGKSVQVASADGSTWLALGPAESVCCPTCGQTINPEGDDA